MIVIPAIDLKNGKVVRLTQGRFDETIYSSEPLKIAQIWKSEGAQLLHIVDLDGAMSGVPQNLDFVRNICLNIDIPVQFGGGVRDRATIINILSSGVSKVIIGTKALDFEFLKSVVMEFKDKILVSVDTIRDKVFTEGWVKSSVSSGLERIIQLKNFGLKSVIFTDISRDGTMQGPNFEMATAILEQGNISLIVAGGIGSLEDIKKLNNLNPQSPYGVIVGKALYEGKFKLYEAINITKNVNEKNNSLS